MENIKCFSAVTIGEKHKAKGKPCQDYVSHYEEPEKGLYITVLSDGHGSNRYFRSQVGSQLVTEITMNALKEFVEVVDKRLFDATFTAIPARTTIAEKDLNIKLPESDRVFRQLFASIITKWNQAITDDWNNNKPTEKELLDAGIEKTIIADYLNNKDIELAYGCTLLALVRTSDYWLGFQLGDGKCVAFEYTGEWKEPIPWDDHCSGNITTSLCQENPVDSFKYAYGTAFYPVLFIGSDGMDGAYGSDEEMAMQNLALLYGGIIKSFAKNGFNKAISEIAETLPKLSKKGVSQDDISLAGIIDLKAIQDIYPKLLEKELELTHKKEKIITDEIAKKQTQLIDLESNIAEKKANFDQLREELKNAEEEKEKLEDSWKIIFKEKEKAFQKWNDLQKAIEKLEKEIERVDQDMSSVKNDFQNYLQEKQNIKEKAANLQAEILQTVNTNMPEPEKKLDKTTTMTEQPNLMKKYLSRYLELAERKRSLINADSNAEQAHLKNRVEELNEELNSLDEQLSNFKEEKKTDDKRISLTKFFDRLIDEGKNYDSISRSEGQLDDYIFSRINENVVNLICGRNDMPEKLFLLKDAAYSTDSIKSSKLLDLSRNEISEISKLENTDNTTLAGYYVRFFERLMQLKEQDQKSQ